MTLFQLVMLIAAIAIFFIFFRQLFSGNYPKRGVDFETDTPNDMIGGITESQKTFAKPATPQDRISQLIDMADAAAQRDDWVEVKKAMQSAEILDSKNTEVMRRLAAAYMHMNDFSSARKIYESILDIDGSDDLAEASLANALHKLGEDDAAILHHERSIVLDSSYAPHYYNYANTLYDMGQKEKALEFYHKALEIDPDLKQARDAIEEIEG